MCYNNVRIPILAAVGLVLALVGILGYTVIFPTMMSISGQDFVSQASEDANNNQNFKDYDSGDKVIIVDEVVRMQYGYDGEKATSVWVESIGKSDQSIRFVCDSNYMNDFGIGSNVIITLEITKTGQSESFTCNIDGRLSTTNEYAFVGLSAIGLILTAYGFYSSFRGSDKRVADDGWGSFDAPVAPVAPPVAPPMSAPPAMMPPSDAAIPQQPVASPPAQPVLPPAAAPTTMTITVPPGVAPGQVLTVTMPSGQVVNVQVPPGCAPGSQFTISVTQ